MGENGNVLIIPPPIPSRSWLHLRLHFFIFTRSQALLVGFTIFDCDTLASKTSLYEGDSHLFHTFSTDVFPTYVQRMEAKY